MKKAFFLLIVLVSLSSVSRAEKGHSLQLPAAARRILDKKYPGWKIAKVGEEIRRYYKKSDAELNLVRGDFDGSGQMDYALQIEYGVEFNKFAGKNVPKVHFVALLRKAGTYKLQVIDAEGGGDFLILWKKGDQGYNYETRKNFIFKNDAVEAVIYEKAGISYIYEKGKFRAVVTGD